MPGLMTYLPLVLSTGAVIGTGLVYYKFNENYEKLQGQVDNLAEDVNSLEIETRAFRESPGEQEDSEENLFQKNVRELAEKLFKLLKSKHQMQEVTTYSEMTDRIEEMDATDDILKEELLEFYESAIRLEYSDEELSEQEKEKMKETAVNLIKRTGQDLEDLE